jgi:hypothetical protein
MLKHAEKIALRLADEEKPKLVVEIASNDGYLLQFYKQRGIPVLGIEPARNIAKVAEEKGIRTISEFFGKELADKLVADGHRADVMHANNVLAHVADLNGVVAGISTLLADRGVAVVEAPYVKDFIDHCEFDTIYHEHLCYFSLTALDKLATRHGLVVRDVERLPIHGGSLRIFFAPAKSFERGPRVRQLLAEEAAWGVADSAFYAGFARRVEALKESFVTLLQKVKREGKRVAAYGAAAKGSTLINYFGVGRDLVDFVVDRSTYKQGRYMPGVKIPIHAPPRLLEEQPDYCVLLTWNFAAEILEQQKAYRDKGGKFIVPIPEVKVV